MSTHGEVLVAILNNRTDWMIAREQHWYRIPIEQVKKLTLRQQWLPPQGLGFYQTKEFGAEAFTIQYYANVKEILEVSRQELFPEEPQNAKSENRYCKLVLEPILTLPRPIKSDRLRRMTFIATTWEKFMSSQEIGEL